MNDAPTAAQVHRHPDHPPVRTGGIGVLLVNLGTPDATDYWSMRRYLAEFLSDPRVIEENRLKWWLVLNLIILSVRPRRRGRDYQRIWNREQNESPLKTITRAQADKLAAALAARDVRIVVDWAMRYGNPSIAAGLNSLKDRGCERILIMPLYPQYAAATTATVCDKAFETLATMRWQPAVRVLPAYYDDPVYIDAIASSIRSDLAKLPFAPDMILASFHGMPEEYLTKGDPYHCQCAKTARLLREQLGFDEARFMLTFQSRFGSAEWLKPYTDETVRSLARRGIKNLAVVMPGFAADCLETLDEIGHENAEVFRHNGGENFAALPCLNDGEAGMALLRHLAERELQGWIS